MFITFLNSYLFFSLFFAGCKKDVDAVNFAADTSKNVSVHPANNTSNGSTETASGQTQPPSAPSPDNGGLAQTDIFDADLNKRGDLSAYEKTSGNPFTAMIINPQCIKIVEDPVYGKKRNVMLMDVKTEDNGGVTVNPRAQVQTPMKYVEGQEIYAGFSVRFKNTFWTYFLTFAEFYGAPYIGTSPFRLGIQESNIVAVSNNGIKQTNLWKTPMEADVWYDFVYREVLSSNPGKGKVQVWLRKEGETSYREVLPTTSMATITASNIIGPNYHKLACYYDKTHTFTNASEKIRVNGVKMLMGNHKVGGSFNAVATPLIY